VVRRPVAVRAARDIDEDAAAGEGRHADVVRVEGGDELDGRRVAAAAVGRLHHEDAPGAGVGEEAEDVAGGVGLHVGADAGAGSLPVADLDGRAPAGGRAAVHEGRVAVVPDHV